MSQQNLGIFRESASGTIAKFTSLTKTLELEQQLEMQERERKQLEQNPMIAKALSDATINEGIQQGNQRQADATKEWTNFGLTLSSASLSYGCNYVGNRGVKDMDNRIENINEFEARLQKESVASVQLETQEVDRKPLSETAQGVLEGRSAVFKRKISEEDNKDLIAEDPTREKLVKKLELARKQAEAQRSSIDHTIQQRSNFINQVTQTGNAVSAATTYAEQKESVQKEAQHRAQSQLFNQIQSSLQKSIEITHDQAKSFADMLAQVGNVESSVASATSRA